VTLSHTRTYHSGTIRGDRGEEGTDAMEKRSYPRIPSSLYVKILHDGEMFSAIATNISKNGMSLRTYGMLPVSAHSKILMMLDRILKVRVTVIRAVKLDNVYNELGVEISRARIDYISLIEKIMEVNSCGSSLGH
jgi:hypothetical protein